MSPGTALITGPTAGIGRAFAEQLAARGHDLVLVARDSNRLVELAERLESRHGVRVEVLSADLADRASLATVEARVADPERPVVMLVNNAGFGHKQPFTENSVEDEQQMLDVLVVAVMRLSHAALRGQAARGRGGIINVSSVAAYFPRGTYGAAKAWVNQFGLWAAAEYRSRGVIVTTVCPGFTKTEFHQRMGVRRGTGFLWLEPAFVVERALADFDRGRALSIPGRQYRAIVAATRLVPSRALQTYQSIGRR